jgi:hypothetical protein
MALFQKANPLDVAVAARVKLRSRLALAEAAVTTATSAAHAHALAGADDGVLDADEATMRARVDRVKTLTAALTQADAQVTQLQVERDKAADYAVRIATVEAIEKKLAEIEVAQADLLASIARMNSLNAFAALYVPETNGVLAFLGMAQTQLPDAYRVIDRCLRDQAAAILRHEAPAALRQIVAPVKAVPVAKPPTQIVFTSHAITWRDYNGDQRVISKWRDAELPIAAAAFALKANLAMLPDDERTKKLRGLGQGHPEASWLNNIDTKIGPNVPTAMAGNGTTSPQSVHDPIVASSPFTVVVGEPVQMQVARS